MISERSDDEFFLLARTHSLFSTLTTTLVFSFLLSSSSSLFLLSSSSSLFLLSRPFSCLVMRRRACVLSVHVPRRSRPHATRTVPLSEVQAATRTFLGGAIAFGEGNAPLAAAAAAAAATSAPAACEGIVNKERMSEPSGGEPHSEPDGSAPETARVLALDARAADVQIKGSSFGPRGRCGGDPSSSSSSCSSPRSCEILAGAAPPGGTGELLVWREGARTGFYREDLRRTLSLGRF